MCRLRQCRRRGLSRSLRRRRLKPEGHRKPFRSAEWRQPKRSPYASPRRRPSLSLPSNRPFLRCLSLRFPDLMLPKLRLRSLSGRLRLRFLSGPRSRHRRPGCLNRSHRVPSLSRLQGRLSIPLRRFSPPNRQPWTCRRWICPRLTKIALNPSWLAEIGWTLRARLRHRWDHHQPRGLLPVRSRHLCGRRHRRRRRFRGQEAAPGTVAGAEWRARPRTGAVGARGICATCPQAGRARDPSWPARSTAVHAERCDRYRHPDRLRPGTRRNRRSSRSLP